MGRPLEIRHEAARAGDVRRNVSRVDKAAERLGYRAAVTLDDGLARVHPAGGNDARQRVENDATEVVARLVRLVGQ